MTRIPVPTAEQMDNALQVTEGDQRRAAALLCDSLGATHPAVRAYIERRLDLHRIAPHDTGDYIPASALPPLA